MKTKRLVPSPWEIVPESPPRRAPQPEQPSLSIKTAILRGIGWSLISLLMLVLLGIIGALGVYAYYATKLPSPQELYQRTTPFQSTRIYDRHGKLLFEVFDPNKGRRTVVLFGEIPDVVVDATISTEDTTFFYNPGFNPLAIARSLVQNLLNREMVFGGSTITQQLVKNLFLTSDRTLTRKIKEAILATELTRRYSKVQILEVYLNEVYYGNLAYGIGAAAETYFDKPVSQLNLAEAALLAGMLQSPALYDPYTDPESALARRDTVLRLMREHGYITSAQYQAATREPLKVAPRTVKMEAPHMVMYVREQLEKTYGTEMLYRGGLQVYTTLDLDMQHLAEQVAREKIAQLRDQAASNASLVALDPKTGDVLALLGSVDFYDRAIAGQVNVARMPRQPGSTIKPLTYLAAFERGSSPATMVMDLKQAFPDGANPPYVPVNYDGKEYGPISVRTALACSRNIPAVATLQQVGLPALLEKARQVGITSLTRPDYGLALTLGGGEVTLLELTGAYAALDNGGRRVTPRTILRITDQAGKTILAETTPQMPQVMDARHAYLLTDILADDNARLPSFGPNSPLKLSFPAAAKTGTTNDYRDSWTEGYTPNLVTGVWVGNSDNKPMQSLSGARGAALIWHDFMERALAAQPHPTFGRPAKIVEAEVCPVSGQKRTDLCPPARKDLFLAENAPQESCSVHHRLAICQVSGKLATRFCPAASVVQKPYEDYGPAWDTWARGRGFNLPPRDLCTVHGAPVNVRLQVPPSPLVGVIDVRGSTEVADFGYYVIEYGIGPTPIGWGALTGRIASPVSDGVLCRWETTTLPDGTYSLRVLVFNRQGQSFEAKTVVQIQNVVLEVTPSLTLTASPTTVPSPTPTQAVTATATLAPTLTASPTPPPSPTATLRVTPTRSATATAVSPPTRMPRTTAVPSSTPIATAMLPNTPRATAAPSHTSTVTPTPSHTPTARTVLPNTPAATPVPPNLPTVTAIPSPSPSHPGNRAPTATPQN